jgi:tetratricopeptide (TPR) repeat protein
MKKKLNVRFVLYLLGSLAVLGTATHFLHGYQVQRNAHALLNQANLAQERGEISEATDYLERYLGLRPDDTDALAKFGELLADERFNKSLLAKYRAMLVLNKVLSRDPKRHEVRKTVVKLAIDLGQFTDARNDLTALLVVYPDDGELEMLLARCYEKTSQYKDARKYFARAIRHLPTNLDAYLQLALLLRQRAQDVLEDKEDRASVLKIADVTIDEMVASNRESFRAYLGRANYLRATRPAKDESTTAAVEQDINQAQKLAADEADVILAVAELARQRDKVDEARSHLTRGCELHAQDWRLYKALGRLEATSGHPEAAVNNLHRGLKQVPGQPDLLWDLAELQIQTRQQNEAYETIGLLGKVGVPVAFQECLKAKLAIAYAKWQDAIGHLELAIPPLVDFDARLSDAFAAQLAQQAGVMLGQCYEQLGNSDRALKAYRRVVTRDTRSIPGLYGMGRCSLALGRLQEALDQYQQMMRLPDAPVGGLVEIARLVLLRNLERPEKEQNWSEVEQAIAFAAAQLHRLKIELPVEVVILDVECKAAQGHFNEARVGLLEKYPDPKTRPSAAWAALAYLEQRQDRQAAGIALLDEAESQTGDHIDLRLARARLLAGQKLPEIQKAMARLDENTEKFSTEDQQRLVRGLASASLQVGDLAGAVRLWEKLVKLRPSDANIRLILFDIATQTGETEKMRTLQDEMKAIEKDDGDLWRYARGRYLIELARRDDKEKSGLAEARNLITSVAERRPDWSRVPLCEALLDDLSGRPDLALVNYLKALRLGPVEPLAILRAAELLYFNGRYDEANKLFGRVPNLVLPQAVQQLAADAALQAQDAKRALELAQSAVSVDSKDHRHHLWLGRMYWNAGEVDKAKAEFVKARDLADSNPDVWVALVQFLSTVGQADSARAEVEAAERRLTGPAGRLALAVCNETIGKSDRADKLFKDALSAAPEDPSVLRGVADYCLRSGRLSEARDDLRVLMNISEKSSETFATARRTLAYLLTLEGDPEKAREALTLLDPDRGDKNASGSVTVLDRRARAQILAMQNSKEKRRLAAQILEELIDQHLASPDDYHLVAQLHDALGDWPKSRKRYLELRNLPGGDTPQFLATAARSFILHGEADEAAVNLDKLETKHPKLQLTCEVKARFLQSRGQTAEAIALVKNFAKTPSVDLRALAMLLAELGDYAGAETTLRQFVAQSKEPDSALVLIRYMIDRKKYGEALDLCDQAWETCSSIAVAEACLHALAAEQTDPRRIDRVEVRLRAAISKSDRPPPELLLALATIRNFQGRYDDAAALYRRVLEMNSRNGTALNNLAWILALQGGHGPEALSLADRAVEVSGHDAGALDTRAVAALSLEKSDANRIAIDRAILDLETLTAEAPTATAYFHLAQAYSRAERQREAAQAWQRAKALGLNPEQLHPLERPGYERLQKELN